jgi:hypothetical protein
MFGVVLLAAIGINGVVTPFARMPDDVYSGWYDDYANYYEAALDYNEAGRRDWPHRIFGCLPKPAGTGLDGRPE